MAERRSSQRSKANLPALRARLGDDLRLERQPRDGMTLTFKCFLLAGAVPPYSDFLIAVLRHYGIRLAHLTPYSIIVLSVFAYLSHQFLGEPPSLDLFRWYYFCRTHRLSNSNSNSSSPPTSLKHANAVGTCHFHLREGKSTTEFIHVPWRGHFHQWKDEWLYVQDGSGGGAGLAETAIPAAPAESAPSWQAEPQDTPELADLRARVADLQRRGLTGAMVMADAIMRRLAPLRNDMHIFPPEAGLLDQNQINVCMVETFGNSIRDQDTALPYNIMPRIAMATGREVEADDGEEDSVVTPHVMLPQPFESSEELLAKDDADLESVFFKAAQYGVRLKGDLEKIKTENESLKRELKKAREELNLSRSQVQQARAESIIENDRLKKELKKAREDLNIVCSQAEHAREDLTLCRSQAEHARAESKIKIDGLHKELEKALENLNLSRSLVEHIRAESETEIDSLKKELEKVRAEQQSDKDSHARKMHQVAVFIDQKSRQLREQVSILLSTPPLSYQNHPLERPAAVAAELTNANEGARSPQRKRTRETGD